MAPKAMENRPWNLGRRSLAATSDSCHVSIVMYIDADGQLCGACRQETSMS
jgi:hypothetical protein